MRSNYKNENQKIHESRYQNNFQKLANMKIAVTQKQYTFDVVNNAWNFHFHWINAVIQFACIVSSTSIFTCQMIVVADFLSADLNGLAQTEQFVALLHSFHCSRVSRFMGILLASCCLKIFATARTWFENFSVVSSPIFTWGASKYHP